MIYTPSLIAFMFMPVIPNSSVKQCDKTLQCKDIVLLLTELIGYNVQTKTVTATIDGAQIIQTKGASAIRGSYLITCIDGGNSFNLIISFSSGNEKIGMLAGSVRVGYSISIKDNHLCISHLDGYESRDFTFTIFRLSA